MSSIIESPTESKFGSIPQESSRDNRPQLRVVLTLEPGGFSRKNVNSKALADLPFRQAE